MGKRKMTIGRPRSLDERSIVRGGELVAAGMSLEEAGRAVNLNPCSLRYALAVRGIRKKGRRRNLPTWSEAEDWALKSAYLKIPASKIGSVLGKTRNAVIGRAWRLGLCSVASA